MKYPIEYFFTPDKLKKGDMIMLNKTDFIFVEDTIYIRDPFHLYRSFCLVHCDVNRISNSCCSFVRDQMPEKLKKKYMFRTCPGMFYDEETNTPWMHIYKVCMGGA